MTNQGNVVRTVPVILLRVAGGIAVLGCVLGLVGMLGNVLPVVYAGVVLLVLAAATAAGSLIARIAR